MRTLFLNPPPVAGFDGGAGSRYQSKHEIRSLWYPTRLAQPAALVPASRLVPDGGLIDEPPRGLALNEILPLATEYERAVLHASMPSFASGVRVARTLKLANPKVWMGRA